MGTVVIGVECRAAGADKCFARELISVAEDATVPLTWLIGVSLREPMGNASLYHTEYLHRIPAWHEIGVLLDMMDGNGSDDLRRRNDLARLGKEMLKQCHVKPVCCKIAGSALQACDVRALEDLGIMVAAGRVDGRTGPLALPYRPSHDDPALDGTSRLVVLAQEGIDLVESDPAVNAKIDSAVSGEGVAFLTVRDDRDDTSMLAETIARLRTSGHRFSTLTPAAAV